MDQYETSTTVSGQGEIHLAGVPFVPGTSVEVTVREKTQEENASQTQTGGPRDVFARIQGRNTESIGPLNREELYDREVFRRH